MAAGYMASHMMTQHAQVEESRQSCKTPATGDGPWTYGMAFPAKGVPRSCPVELCLGRVATRTVMQEHFLHRHVLDTVVILEE